MTTQPPEDGQKTSSTAAHNENQVRVPPTVYAQLEALRQSGGTNMFTEVRAGLRRFDFAETHDWIAANPDTYAEGLQNGFILTDPDAVEKISWEQEDDRNDANKSQSVSYLLACPNGCTEWGYQQRSKRIKNPWLYTCPECEATLVSCDGQDTPTAFDPGTCNVESIPWTEPQVVHGCPNGCFSVGHVQHCDETRQPEQYGCGECDTRTISYPTGQRPNDPSPGTNYTD